jgi:Tfp pilus assembly protein PilO
MKMIRLILAGILLIAAFAAAFLFVWPKYQAFLGIREEMKLQEESVVQREALLAKQRQLKKQAEERKEDFEKIDIAVPKELALPKVYHEFQEMGADSGLSLMNISDTTETTEEVSSLRRSVVSLEFQGTYEGIKNFLSAVKSSARVFNMQSLTIQTQKESRGILQFHTKIETYASVVEPEAAGEDLAIDFGIFDDPIFEELSATSSEITAPEGVERENPFIPL